MVHGWGYDKDGYPVPNGSGELVFNEDLNKYLSVSQKVEPDGTVSEPHRLKTFFPGWAQQPGTWPVGPIDLRWDGEAGVWTVGSQYKNVWVKIEVDLVGTEPARGTIIGEVEALPKGKRRLVFVRDYIGSFSAPRGADLYCSYDPDSGFYQPVYSKSLITTGTFESNSVASIDQKYMSDYTDESYEAAFDNPLGYSGFSTGDVGIFSYINGEWVLTSIK